VNPFALSGPEFLALFIGLLGVLLVVAGLVRTSLRGPSDDRFPATLDSYQAALLAAGYQGAAEAAIVALSARGSLRVDPGGRFVAIREPVWPLVKLRSRARARARLVAAGVADPFYTLADYREFFTQAGFSLEARRVNLARGFRYYVNKLVNGLTHARYAFIAVKRGRS